MYVYIYIDSLSRVSERARQGVGASECRVVTPWCVIIVPEVAKGVPVKVIPRFEVGRFGRIVRVGGSYLSLSQPPDTSSLSLFSLFSLSLSVPLSLSWGFRMS